MTIFEKLGQVLLIFATVAIWNRFVPQWMIGSAFRFHKKHNANNLHKQPIKFFIEHEADLIKIVKAFYWFGFAIIAFGLFSF